MASNDDHLRLRRMTGEVGSNTYTDTDLDEFITQAGGDLNMAASLVWREKASDYADSVDISESGSSRKNSDLFKHAKEQEASFLAASSAAVVDTSGFTTTRRIVRP